MRIMVLGAGGFIGRAIVAELIGHGHQVVAVQRPGRSADALPPGAEALALDLARATSPADWREAVRGVDMVVNAAGILRGAQMEAVHVAMPVALHQAASEAGVRRVVLISAISARPDVPTDYAQSKLRGEAALRQCGLGWTILRPSLVYGEGSYGGTSLLRGLAALPWRVPLPGEGQFAFSPIHVRDLARAVREVCEDERHAGQVLDPCGPETLSLSDLLGRYRRWLGFGEARFVAVPMSVMRLLGRIGDRLGDGPVSTNSLVQLVAGNAGDGEGFARTIGFAPRSLGAALRESPAQVQDRWHARLFFLAPAIRWTLAMLWLVSALLGLGWGADQARAVVAGLGLPQAMADPLRWGGSALDLVIAALVLADRRGRIATGLQLLSVAGYSLVIGLAIPALWLDPLGPLLKNLPILVLILVHGAIAERR